MRSNVFISPTEGKLTLKQAYQSLIKYIRQEPHRHYKLIIGTDSQNFNSKVHFVTAIIIYRVGKGGRFFYNRRKETIGKSLRQRIYYETTKSLEVAAKITGLLAEESKLIEGLDIEIHLDVGKKGPTNEMIKEVVGMVTGSGYGAIIKPDSFGASKVADKYTR